MRRVARDALIALAAIAALLLAGAPGGNPAIVARTRALAAGHPYDDPRWLDHAQQARRLRPWQPGFSEARAELAAIDRARRRASGAGGP